MNLIPKPQKYIEFNGTFTLDAETKVYCDGALKESAAYFCDFVEQRTGVRLQEGAPEEAKIQFCVPASDKVKRDGYAVSCGDVLCISAAEERGCFYAVQTLLQLFCLDTADSLPLTAKNCHIADFPRYRYRGLMLDIARHFHGVEEIKNILTLMSRVKLNKLHLHLSDDQGFRVQIDKYPKLNEIGSFRNGTERQTADGSFVDEERYGGFLTKEDVKEIVAFAAKLHVDVVPEIEVPGHAVAVIAAYPHLSCTGEETEVRKRWGISKDILCGGNEDVYDFVRGVLDEICEMFPSEYLHLGGDEAPKDRWCNCAKCAARMSELKLSDANALQSHMINVFADYLREKGRKVIVWNDGAEGTVQDVVCQYWRSFKGKMRASKHVNRGREVVYSDVSRLYFDYPYAMTPLKRTYGTKLSHIGCRRKNAQYLLGAEGTLWTEYLTDEGQLQYNMLPRMLALAECCWGTNHSYNHFKKRAERYFAVYDTLGVTYDKETLDTRKNRKKIKFFFKTDRNAEYNDFCGRKEKHD